MSAPRINLLLEALSPESRSHLLSLSKEVPLPLRATLQPQGEKPKYAYFMLSGITSVVVSVPEGGTAEVTIIGREGVTGCLSLLGPSAPPTESFIQVSGSAYRILFADLKKAFTDSEEIRNRILELVQQQALTMTQVVACNKLHNNEGRLARWLLMVQDRLEDDFLPLTQEFVAQMLGSRRTTVALSAGAMQRAGLIEYKRGKVRVLSRAGLEEAACDCYTVAKRLRSALYRA